MSRLSTIPITLDPSLYRREPPVRTVADTDRRRSRSITLVPAVYDPSASRKRNATDQHRARSKALPPRPKSPWPVTGGETERRVFSNPPSRQGTMEAVPLRRPAVAQERAPPRQPNVPAPKRASPSPSPPPPPPPPPPPVISATKFPPSPPSRSSTLVESPGPSFQPQLRGKPTFQTRYMDMLLSLDQIPRLHNILASLFGWLMLAGFVVFPGTFTSLARLQRTAAVQQVPGASGVLDTVQSLPLLVVAAVCCAVGYLGSLWLSVRHRRNHVWLLNRLYMPGALNALTGLVSTLTNIYSQHKGSWNVSARVAVVVESVTLVLYLVLFVLYNNWLLKRVKEQHNRELDGGFGNTFKGRVEKLAKQPAVAPGSIV